MSEKKAEKTKKVAEEAKPWTSDLPMVEAKPAVKAETKIEPIPQTLKKLSDTVTVKVLIGSMHFEQGSFSKGDTFMVSRERVKLFWPNDIQILE